MKKQKFSRDPILKCMGLTKLNINMPPNQFPHYNKQIPSSMQQKIEVISDDHSLQINFTDTLINFVLINLAQGFGVKKFARSLDFTGTLLSQFGSPKGLDSFMRNRDNYTVDATNGIVILKWQIMGAGFSRTIEHPIELTLQQMTEEQALECEVMVLRKKLAEVKERLNIDTEEEEEDPISFTHSFNSSDSQSSRVVIRKKVKRRRIRKSELERLKSNKRWEASNSKLIKKVKAARSYLLAIKPKRAYKRRNFNLQPEPKIMIEAREKPAQSIMKECSPEESHRYVAKKIGSKMRVDFSNGDFYEGQMKNRKFHGQGFYFSKLNGTYEGEWKWGKLDGFAQTRDKLGNRYEGMYKDDMRHGKGIDTYCNGERYEGEFYKGLKQGFGTYHYKNGDYYVGEWRNDLADGKGKEYYSDGSAYIGVWLEDEKHGEGVLYKKNFETKQVWKNGKLQLESNLMKKTIKGK